MRSYSMIGICNLLKIYKDRGDFYEENIYNCTGI